MSSYIIKINKRAAGLLTSSDWAWVGVNDEKIAICAKPVKTSGICYPVSKDSSGNIIISLNTTGNGLEDRLSQLQRAIVHADSGLLYLTPSQYKPNVRVTKFSDHKEGSKYALDFNTRASLAMHNREADYLEVRQTSKGLMLVAVDVKTPCSSHILCNKGGNTLSATFTPTVFGGTKLNPDFRYRMTPLNDREYLIEAFEAVSYYGEKIRYQFPVVTISYDRSPN